MTSWTETNLTAFQRRAIAVAAFVLIVAGYGLTFSVDENDALDTAGWMEQGDIFHLLEFRHLVQRMLPFWLWHGLNALGLQISALWLLDIWDFLTAAASVMLVYVLIREFTSSRWVTFGATFGYATAHCVWLFTGSGRLYTTSMFLAFAAYYLAIQIENLESEFKRWMTAAAAGALVCFSCYFWLTQSMNAIGAGLMLLFIPASLPWKKRIGYFAAYSATGALVAVIVLVSCLHYIGVPLEPTAVKGWMAAAGTQPPVEFNVLSPMKAAFGQAQGILVMWELSYMINGLMIHDSELVHLASLPWQLSKFIFVWALLLLAYLYPLFIWRKSSTRLKTFIAVLYVPLAINLYFGLGWLGSDKQRFLPSMLSQFGLAAISVTHWLNHSRRPRVIGGVLLACLAFIAGENYRESMLPAQSLNIVMKQEMLALRPQLRRTDFILLFGRDMPSSFPPMIEYYAGPRYLPMTNDVQRWNWERRDWQSGLNQLLRSVWITGGHVFVMDRMALGFLPREAAWSEKQHPSPTIREFAAHLRAAYCVTSAFTMKENRYYQVAARGPECAAGIEAGTTLPVQDISR